MKFLLIATLPEEYRSPAPVTRTWEAGKREKSLEYKTRPVRKPKENPKEKISQQVKKIQSTWIFHALFLHYL